LHFPIDPNEGFWYFGIALDLPISEQPNDLSMNFWRIYEMGFPEGSPIKVPKGSIVSLWNLFC
jgi:hypothetical protein